MVTTTMKKATITIKPVSRLAASDTLESGGLSGFVCVIGDGWESPTKSICRRR